MPRATSGREANIIFIISKATGKIVWKLGPDYDNSPEAKAIGWIIGQHHCHMVPRGLPGEGNILIFDNGGWGGYDVPNPGSPTGVKAALRDHSRVLEIDPVAMKIVWQYTPTEAGFLAPMDCNRFYSPFISGMQRLPNGNTLITEGSDGRVFEVTKDHELVWEFISPYWGQKLPMNMVYRAYRVPYEWVPQLGKQEETPIERIDVNAFRMPGAAALGDRDSEIAIEGCAPYQRPPSRSALLRYLLSVASSTRRAWALPGLFTFSCRVVPFAKERRPGDFPLRVPPVTP